MTTTSDARKRLAEKSAEQPTPAPVTAPEGGWREGDRVVVERGRYGPHTLTRDAIGEWYGEDGRVHADDGFLSRDHSGYFRVTHVAPRPEPVADPVAAFQYGRCTECRATGSQCEDADGGCCDVCRATGGCSHPREPVADPLPSEADRDALVAVMQSVRVYGRMPYLNEYAEALLAAGYHLRTEDDEDAPTQPAPELDVRADAPSRNDEDTVRVPREAVERLRASRLSNRHLVRAARDLLDVLDEGAGS